jgi:hypothetical protein
VSKLLRCLHVGWIGLCFVPCIILIVLWWRSYRWTDHLVTHATPTPLELLSGSGRIKMTRAVALQQFQPKPASYQRGQSEFETITRHIENFDAVWGIGVVGKPNPAIVLPYWFLAVLSAAVGTAAARIRWSLRYRLRTLLITMTGLAVLFTTIMWWLR